MLPAFNSNNNNKQTIKQSTCAHLSSHCTADQSSTTTVSEEEQEERRTKILSLNLAVLPKIHHIRAGVYYVSFMEQWGGRDNSCERQKEGVEEREWWKEGITKDTVQHHLNVD